MQKLIIGTIFFLLVALIIFLYTEISSIRDYMKNKDDLVPSRKLVVQDNENESDELQ